AQTLNLTGAVYAPRMMETIALVAKNTADRVTAIDLQTGKPASHVVIHTRDNHTGAVHMLVNTAESRDVSLQVHIPKPDQALVAVYDAFTAELYKAPLTPEGTLAVTLAPAGSLVILTGQHASPAQRPCPA